MMPSTSNLLLLLLTSSISKHNTALGACVDSWTGRVNNIRETSTEGHVVGTAAEATGVALIGKETADELDISKYFQVSLNGSDVVVTPKSTLNGVRDYPVNAKSIRDGTVAVNCSGTIEEKTLYVTVVGENTVAPRAVYIAEVEETFPVGLPIPGLLIGGTDYDADYENNEVSFYLEDTSGTFSLTPVGKILANPAVYSTRLVLTQSLDWSQQSQYRVTVTATDPGGMKTASDVIINVVTNAGISSKAADQPKPMSEVKPEASSRIVQGSKVTAESVGRRSEVRSDSTGWSAVKPRLPKLTEEVESGAECVDTTEVKTRLYENTTVPVIIKATPDAISVSLSGNAQDGAFNLSQYFTVSLDDGKILLNPIQPDLSGVRDYPIGTSVGRGNCTVTCSGSSQMFPIQVIVLDSNTAGPVMAEETYTAEVLECMLVNTTVPGLYVNASDYDADSKNNNLTFSLEDSSGTFVLTPPEKTDSWPMTFSVQLVSTRTLDWSQQSQYRLTVTARDPAGQTATSDVIITVLDADNKAPQFKHSGYTAEIFGREDLGQLTVHPEAISAFDPDTGGPLRYSLIDLPGANWSQHFHLESTSAQISLAEKLPAHLTIPSEITLIVEVVETEGAHFSARTVLVVHLGEKLRAQSLEDEPASALDSEQSEKTQSSREPASMIAPPPMTNFVVGEKRQMHETKQLKKRPVSY